MEGRAQFHESNDCTVRAFASATSLSYAISHTLALEAGRVNRKGFWTRHIAKRAVENGWIKDYTETPMLDLERAKGYSGYTNQRWANAYPTLAQAMPLMMKGRYMVETANHAFAVVDGVIHDNSYKLRMRRRVIRILEITLKEVKP
jgi:hypothetical protein